ncbi:MAG: (Fe-S)-binding protein [Candidatus Bathyarchaeia archaeon]
MREIHYWSGCTFRARYPKDVEAHIDLLKILNYDVKRIDGEGCCGYPLILAGEIKEAEKVASLTAKKLHDVKRLVTECPGCYRVFKEEYPKMRQLAPEVYHLSQVLAEHIEFFGDRVKDVVSYNDPCDLDRLGGDYDSPRKVLSSFAKIVEPIATKENANCCGAGGLLLMVEPELSIRIGEARIRKDFEPLGVSKLITACPSCLFNLSVASARMELDKNLEVIDLASYVYSRLKENDRLR